MSLSIFYHCIALVSVVASQFQFILMSRLSSFQLACSGRSDSRARLSDGEKRVKFYIGKTGEKKTKGEFFSLREFFSSTLLSVRLNKATFRLSNLLQLSMPRCLLEFCLSGRL